MRVAQRRQILQLSPVLGMDTQKSASTPGYRSACSIDTALIAETDFERYRFGDTGFLYGVSYESSADTKNTTADSFRRRLVWTRKNLWPASKCLAGFSAQNLIFSDLAT